MTDIEDRLAELRELGLYRRTRMVSGPQGPRVVLDGQPVLLLCSNNYLGLADHPRVREAAADAAMRWGVGAGRRGWCPGTMTVHRRLEERLAGFEDRDAALLFGSGYLANLGVVSALAGARLGRPLRRAQPRVDRRRLPPRARRDVRLPPRATSSTSRGGCASAEGRSALIVTDSVFSMDGDVAPLRRDRRARPPPRRARGRRRGARDRVPGPGRPGRRARGRRRGRGRRRRRHARQGARHLRRVRRVRPRHGAAAGEHGAAVHLLDGAAAAGGGRALAALDLLAEQPERVDRLQANAARAARRAAPRGLRRRRLDDADRAARRRRGGARDADVRARARARRVRPGDPSADRARAARRGCGWR